ncbi:MAG: hypothetical protein NTV81_00175, partial [Candidatus Komeilibacteria bacterium]|nr:hypothetical protein [Candidatus Komeilibacteria bacterium]
RADLYRQFMLTWFLIQGLVVVIFSKQLNAKFLLGFSMPLTIFAVLGVEYTCQKIKDADLRILIKWLLIIFLCLGNVYSVVGNILIYKKPTADFGFVFQPPEVFLATDWAKYNLPRNSIIMANFSAWGNILSGLTGRFSLIGHSGFGMINIKQKNLWVEYFYKDNQDLDNKKELLNFLGVDYVWFGKKEKKLGTFDPGVIDWLELVYRNSAESIYRVK